MPAFYHYHAKAFNQGSTHYASGFVEIGAPIKSKKSYDLVKQAIADEMKISLSDLNLVSLNLLNP